MKDSIVCVLMAIVLAGLAILDWQDNPQRQYHPAPVYFLGFIVLLLVTIGVGSCVTYCRRQKRKVKEAGRENSQGLV